MKDQIIFHGGCNGCTVQSSDIGTVACMRCQYFEADWTLPNLNNKPATKSEIERDRLKALYPKGVLRLC